MEFIKRRLIAGLVMLAVTFVSVSASAEDVYDDQLNTRPSALAMFGDMVLARPLLLVGTVVGTAFFVATLPVTVLGGNTKEAAQTLVVGPAKATFTRCLGCTKEQDDWKHKSDKAANDTAQAQAAPQPQATGNGNM